MAVPQERFRPGERVLTSPAVALGVTRVSWGGVWSGLLTSLGVLLLLGTLGLAIGISAVGVGTSEGAGARGLGIGAGVWGFVTLVIALFLGGLIASWVTPMDRGADAIHGALVWVLAMIAILYLATSGIALGASALFGVAGVAARAAGGTITMGAAGLADLARGDVDQILARLNDPTTIATVAGATGMTQDEARATLANIRQRVEAARNDPARAAAEARAAVEQLAARAGQQVTAAAQAAQPYAATTSWLTLGAMVISLIAAVAGAVWGGKRAREVFIG